MIKCECEILGVGSLNWKYIEKDNWPDCLAIEPKVGHHILSNDGKMMGIISNIIHYRKKEKFSSGGRCFSKIAEEPIVILKISNII